MLVTWDSKVGWEGGCLGEGSIIPSLNPFIFPYLLFIEKRKWGVIQKMSNHILINLCSYITWDFNLTNISLDLLQACESIIDFIFWKKWCDFGQHNHYRQGPRFLLFMDQEIVAWTKCTWIRSVGFETNVEYLYNIHTVNLLIRLALQWYPNF